MKSFFEEDILGYLFCVSVLIPTDQTDAENVIRSIRASNEMEAMLRVANLVKLLLVNLLLSQRQAKVKVFHICGG